MAAPQRDTKPCLLQLAPGYQGRDPNARQLSYEGPLPERVVQLRAGHQAFSSEQAGFPTASPVTDEAVGGFQEPHDCARATHWLERGALTAARNSESQVTGTYRTESSGAYMYSKLELSEPDLGDRSRPAWEKDRWKERLREWLVTGLLV